MGQFKESTMKSFAFVCLFAAAYAAPAADADAEADPALLYSSLGYGGYTGYHHPYTYGAYAPYVAAVPAVHSAAVKSVVETPAEVKTTVHAAPVVTYNAVHHASPVVYNTAAHVASPVVYNTVAAPVVQKAGYYANSGGAVHIVKREAEADADADAAYYYSGYRSPYVYGAYRRPFYGVHPYTYGFNHGYYGGYYY